MQTLRFISELRRRNLLAKNWFVNVWLVEKFDCVMDSEGCYTHCLFKLPRGQCTWAKSGTSPNNLGKDII